MQCSRYFLECIVSRHCCVIKTSCCSCVSLQICLKGKVHIFKFLSIQACLRIDKKPDSLDLPSLGKRIPSQPLTDRWVVGFLSIENIFCKGCLLFYGRWNYCFILVWVLLCVFHNVAWRTFIPIKTMDQTLALEVIMGIKGCPLQKWVFFHCWICNFWFFSNFLLCIFYHLRNTSVSCI